MKVTFTVHNFASPRTMTAQSVHWLCYRLDNQGIMVPFPGRIRDFLFFKASRLASEHTHPPIQ